MRTIHREVVGGFIFSNDNYILLGSSQPGGVYQGYSTIPGGGVEEGETLLEALRREILEETHLDVQDAETELVNTQSGESEKTLRDTGEQVLASMRFHDFRVAMPAPASDLVLEGGDDFANPQWVPVSELPILKLTEPTMATLGKLGLL